MVSRSAKGRSFSTNSGVPKNTFAASQCPNGIFSLVDSFDGLGEQSWSTEQPGFANYPVSKTTETTENLLCIWNVRAAERIE